VVSHLENKNQQTLLLMHLERTVSLA